MNQKNLKRKVPKSSLRSNSKCGKMTESKHFELEELFLRFLLVAQLILTNLDDQSLVKFNELSKELHHNDIKKKGLSGSESSKSTPQVFKMYMKNGKKLSTKCQMNTLKNWLILFKNSPNPS